LESWGNKFKEKLRRNKKKEKEKKRFNVTQKVEKIYRRRKWMKEK
jgi:hypothetical protein